MSVGTVRGISHTLNMRMVRISIPLYPTISLVGLVIGLHAANECPITSLVRPMLLAAVAMASTQVLIAVVAKGSLQAHFLGWLAVLAILSPPLAGIVAVILAGYVLRKMIRHEDGTLPWPTLTAGLNVFSVAFVVLAAINGLQAGSLTPFARSLTATRDSAHVPNVYVLLLDGHPRRDTLFEQFGYDLSPFVSKMESIGFHESRGARSSYDSTQVTLTSMFAMSPLDRLPGLSTSSTRPPGQLQVQRVMNSGSGIAQLRAHDYEVWTIPSPFVEYALLGADRVIETGHLTTFELRLIRTSLAGLVLSEPARRWVLEDLRGRVIDTLDVTASLAEEPSSRPRFLFSHILSPHLPRLFGSRAELPSCYPGWCSVWSLETLKGRELAIATAEHVSILDDLVARTAARIVEADPEAVVIVMSDHGMRHDPTDSEETHRSLFLARTPGRPGLFPDNPSTVDLVPRLLNGYANTDLPYEEDVNAARF